MATTELAYREANRIRHEDGHGYADFVKDSTILRHAIGHMDEGNYRQARWCLAVLDLRISERSATLQ